LTTLPKVSRLHVLLAVLAALACATAARAAKVPAVPPAAPPQTAAPAPPSGLDFADVPNDAGTAIDLKWKPSPDDAPGSRLVTGYVLERAASPAGPWAVVDSVSAGTLTRVDASVKRNTPYFYRVAAYGPGGLAVALANAGPAIARRIRRVPGGPGAPE